MRTFVATLIFASNFLGGAAPTSAAESTPRVFLLDAARLDEARRAIADGDQALAAARAELDRRAQDALKAGPYSVVSKDSLPPSGDKHDYMSLAPYWWPNPDTPDGLPYIRRDGERNPEIYKIRNRLDLGELADAIETLSLAYYFTGTDAYAQRAALLIHSWFIDPATRMNPHLRYGQAIRGVNDGRAAGLIETRAFTRVADSIGLLAGSRHWNAEDQQAMTAWFAAYLDWMQTSDIGREESDSENNHGTFYDVQVASYALFLDRPEAARKVVEAAKEKRIALQIESDGSQPLELERTKAFSYSVGNLAGLMSLARLGEHVGVDLWRYETADGRSIRRALDYLTPYGLGEKKWPYQQINGFDATIYYPLLRIAASKYPDAAYRELFAQTPALDDADAAILWQSPLEPINKLHLR